jgi:hypothetical protein
MQNIPRIVRQFAAKAAAEANSALSTCLYELCRVYFCMIWR